MKRWLAFITPLVLAGCETEINVAQICEQKPAVCNDLWDDSHCKLERANVIFARFDEAKVPSDINKYKLLTKFEKYSKCMELASGIEHIKLKEKTTFRVNSFMVSVQEIKRLTEETVSSDYPALLYYHWSRHQSQSHLDRFLKAAEANELNTPDLQFALAQHFMSRDTDKALKAMFSALKMYKSGDRVDTDIYTSLTTLYYKKKQYAQSYHWALVAEDAGIERIVFEMILKDLDKQKIDRKKIESIADKTISGINKGQFIEPKF